MFWSVRQLFCPSVRLSFSPSVFSYLSPGSPGSTFPTITELYWPNLHLVRVHWFSTARWQQALYRLFSHLNELISKTDEGVLGSYCDHRVAPPALMPPLWCILLPLLSFSYHFVFVMLLTRGMTLGLWTFWACLCFTRLISDQGTWLWEVPKWDFQLACCCSFSCSSDKCVIRFSDSSKDNKIHFLLWQFSVTCLFFWHLQSGLHKQSVTFFHLLLIAGTERNITVHQVITVELSTLNDWPCYHCLCWGALIDVLLCLINIWVSYLHWTASAF